MSVPERTNPYVGLRPFFIQDSLYFFGREQQTAELLDILRVHRFLGVVGSSGSGKSSLVRAGLLPGLLGGFLVQNRDRWRTVQMKPGDAPMVNLAVGLLEALGQTLTAEAVAALEREIRESHTDAVAGFLAERLEPNANLFLLVDQFEEIFAFRGLQDDDGAKNLDLARRQERARRKAEAADFVDLLLALAAQRTLPIYVSLTMRTDFLGDCDLFYGLPEALNRGRYLVPRMTREQLRDAVECPALLLAAEISPRLLDHVLNELGDRFDRLPVLQHALLRTFDEWQRAGGEGPVDLRHYESAGGLEHALDQDAEGAMQGLDLGVTARAFKRLTDTDQSQRRVRSPARISELMAVTLADRDVVEGIVRRFEEDGRSFLHRSADGKPDDPRVDISHESLIRQWNRLRTWVDEERASRDRYKKLVERAQAGTRILDPELQRVLAWWTEAAPSRAWALRYSTDDEDFGRAEHCLHDSAAARDAELERERQRADADRLSKERELEQAKALAEAQRQRAEEQAAAGVRQRRLNRGLGVSLLVALATVVVAFGLKTRADRALATADREREQRFSQQLTAEAGGALERGATQLAFLLGAAGIRPDANSQTRASFRRLLLAEPNLRAFLSGHQDIVTGVAFSPDRKTLASASWDGTVRLWDLERFVTRGEPLTETDQRRVLTSVAFGDDHTIAVGTADGTVLLWRLDGAAPRVTLLARHNRAVQSVAFSPGGGTLVSASEVETGERVRSGDALVLWNVATGEGVPLRGHEGTVRGVAFSADGQTLASVGVDKSMILWDVKGRRPRAPKLKLDFEPSSVALSPDRKTFAVASAVGVVRLGSAVTGEFLPASPFYLDEGASAVAFSPDGRMLAVASDDGSVARWDLARLDLSKPLPPFKGHVEFATSVAFSADGQTLASAAGDGTVALWTVADVQRTGEPFEGHKSLVRSVNFSPDGRTLASASEDRTVILWDVGTHQPVGAPAEYEDGLTSVAFSPDGRTIASGSEDGVVILWDVTTRQRKGPLLKGHTAAVQGVAFSPVGQILASASDDGDVILWDLAKPEAPGVSLKGHSDYVRAVAFSRDGRLLASASDDESVILWDVATRKPLGAPLRGHKDYVTSVAFSPDGLTLASGSEDRTVILWDVARREPLGTPLRGHKDYVTSVAFSPDGLTLASASEDGSVMLWDVASRRALGDPIMGHDAAVTSVAFSPDGQVLASGSADDTMILWNASLWHVDMEASVGELCRKANRNLTLAEWADHVGKDVAYRTVCKGLPGPAERVK